jgi:hypothetical protein
VTWVMWNLVSVHLKIVLVLVHDRFMVFAKCTIAQKSLWTHLMVLLSDEAQVEACFGPFGGIANLNAR